ncbi:hypothetical protein B7463_g12653, partial [Scytalidium lignicola]
MPSKDPEGHEGVRRQPRARTYTAMDSHDRATGGARRNDHHTAVPHVQRVPRSAGSVTKQVCHHYLIQRPWSCSGSGSYASDNCEASQQRHWAEKIFEDTPKSVTGLRHRRESKCFGPSMLDINLGVTSQSVVLFKLRKGASLQLRRWSSHNEHPTCWTALFFKTWEKMVLFHCAFVALKFRCPFTRIMHPEDFALSGETRLFQGRIIDDGYEHSLAVYQEEKSGGLRLHAAVWSGELKKCPVWTAFVTHQSTSPQWIVRRSKHRIWLKEIYPHVFCKDYKKKHQLKKHGEFEIYFCEARGTLSCLPPSSSSLESEYLMVHTYACSVEYGILKPCADLLPLQPAADAFEDVFREPSETGSIIEANGAGG